MIAQLPWRFRIPRNSPPYEGETTCFLFLTGDCDYGVVAELTAALEGGSLGWVVIPVADSFVKAAAQAKVLLMHVDVGSIGMWGAGL